MLLRPQIAAPTHIARLSAIGLAFAGAGLFAIAKPALETPSQQGTPTIAIAVPEMRDSEMTFDVEVASQTEAPPVSKTSSRSVSMVFEAQGATWMKLENLAAAADDFDGVPRSPFPKHGAIEYTNKDYVEVVTAPIAIDDVPAAHRDRLGDKVIVDGHCTAYVTGFAVVARLTGSTGYAGDDTSGEWTAKSVLQYGAPMIAAKLDGCRGTIARDASLPPAAKARIHKSDDATLVAQAKRMLLRTKEAHATTKEWESHYENDAEERTKGWARHPSTTWKTQMFTHPATQETWISIHANQLDGCGSPHVNVWGLYRVEKDGTLTAFESNLGDIERIDDLVDLDGDGVVEVIGTAWLGATLVIDAKGTVLEQLDVPFYGCPC